MKLGNEKDIAIQFEDDSKTMNLTWDEAKKRIYDGYVVTKASWKKGEHLRLVDGQICFSTPIDPLHTKWNHWFINFADVELLNQQFADWMVV